MKQMVDIILTFNENDLEKIPSLDCSFNEWVKWFTKNSDKVVDWNDKWYNTDEYDDM